MELLEVGKPYIAGHTQWPEAVEYNFRGGEHELRLFWRDPSVREVEGPRGGWVGGGRGVRFFGGLVQGECAVMERTGAKHRPYKRARRLIVQVLLTFC
jgi:hypothetical protein